MQVDEYWVRQRHRVVRWIAMVFVVMATIYVVKFFLRVLLPSLIDQLSSPEYVSRLQVIATIGNLIIGAVLVIVTSIYAWITRATLHEITESRYSAKRPMPLLAVRGASVLKQDGKSIEFTTIVEVTNAGVGVLVRPLINIVLPKEAPVVDTEKWLDPPAWKRTTTVEGLPTLLASGAQVEREVKTWIEVQDLCGDRLRGFMQALLVCEDSDRNLYHLVHEYDLLLHDGRYVSWVLIYERLTMQLAAERLFVHSGVWDYSGTTAGQCLYERITPP